MNTSKILQRQEWLGEISETEPARLTGLISRGPDSTKNIYDKIFYMSCVLLTAILTLTQYSS